MEALIAAADAFVRVVTQEEGEALEVVRGAAMARGVPLRVWTAVKGVHDGLLSGEGEVKDTQNAAAAMTWMAMHNAANVNCVLDVAGAIAQDHVAVRALRELEQACAAAGGTLVTIDYNDQAPAVIAATATAFELSLPGEDELERIVRATVQARNKVKPVSISITRRELSTVVRNLKGLSRRQARRVINDVVCEGNTFNIYDLNSILARKRQVISQGGLLEYVKAPVDLDAIGGMTRLKAWLRARSDGASDDARAFGIDPSRGVLILGVQGSGKSMCAKAIATAWHCPLLRMDMGALYDKFIGESERNLRDALKQAEVMAPIVLWIDEIEKAFAGTGQSGGGSDSGLSKRMFGMLLTWMQEHKAPVFLAATANDIDSLPPELMRKGRFDEIFFVDLPSPTARKEILSIHLQRKKRDPANFDLDRLVRASDGYSGAEIEQGIMGALHGAFDAKREVTTEDVERSLAGSPPLSVTRAEQVEELRAWAKGRCVPAE
jgi:ATP-dependent 26S proteasome regulatory subunit